MGRGEGGGGSHLRGGLGGRAPLGRCMATLPPSLLSANAGFMVYIYIYIYIYYIHIYKYHSKSLWRVEMRGCVFAAFSHTALLASSRGVVPRRIPAKRELW